MLIKYKFHMTKLRYKKLVQHGQECPYVLFWIFNKKKGLLVLCSIRMVISNLLKRDVRIKLSQLRSPKSKNFLKDYFQKMLVSDALYSLLIKLSLSNLNTIQCVWIITKTITSACGFYIKTIYCASLTDV